MKNNFLGISIANNTLLERPLLDDALNLCVSILCESEKMDNCYIYNLKLTKISYSSTNKNIPRKDSFDKENLEYDLKKLFHKKHNLLVEGKITTNNTNESEEVAIRELMRSRNLGSFLLFPIFSNKKIYGFLAFEKAVKTNWHTGRIRHMELLAKNIGIRIYKDSIIKFFGPEIDNIDQPRNSQNEGLWELDLVTSIPTYSGHYAEMTGYAINELQLTPLFWQSCVHPDDLVVCRKKLTNYITNISSKFTGCMRVKHKKGHYIWIKYNGLLQRDSDGNPIRIIGTIVDITDLKEKEIQLRLSEEKYKFITENTTDIICQHNLEGNYIYISKSYTEILGYEVKEMINKNAIDYIHPDDVESVLATYRQGSEIDRHHALTFRFRKKNNSYVWLETTSKCILDSKNNMIGSQTCSRDVTNRIEAALQAKIHNDKEIGLNQMKSDFVVMASHQFRTPLTVIYSNTELLELKAKNLDKETTLLIEHITTRIKKEVDRMTDLMNNVLIFAKYDSQKLQKEIGNIDFDELVKSLIQTYFSNTSDGRKIRVTTKGKRKNISSDESLLVHILTNLINNAFKYSIGKANPSLSVNYLENEIQIEIIDYGIGVPESEVKNLFTSFFRATNTTNIKGSGLGLAIVKQFTYFLNGTIELKTTENQGTTITLKFPYE